MPPRFFNDPPRQQEASPEFTRLLFLVFGVAVLIGLVTGSIWIAWNLIRLHLLH